MQRTGDGHTGWILSGQEIERLGGSVCSLHHACGYEVSWLSLKTKVDSL
jgi:hypothetical protein